VLYLDENSSPYDRDKGLFHELVHVWYGDELNDSLNTRWHGKFADENRAIAERLARKLRANSDLLRYTLDSFELELFVYDGPSYEASYGKNQLVLPIIGDHYTQLRKIILMD